MTNPRQDTWQQMHTPVTIPVHWEFDKKSYDTLMAGVESQNMDERWDIAFVDKAIRCYRSWTGNEIYNFSIKQDGEKYIVGSFNVEQDAMTDSKDDEVEHMKKLLKYVVGVEPL